MILRCLLILISVFFVSINLIKAQTIAYTFEQPRRDGGHFAKDLLSLEGDITGDDIYDYLISSAAATVGKSGEWTGRVYVMNGASGKPDYAVNPPKDADQEQFGLELLSLYTSIDKDKATDWATTDGQTVFVYDGKEGELLQRFSPNTDEKGLSMTLVDDMNGNNAPEIVTESSTEIAFWDSKTGDLLQKADLKGEKLVPQYHFSTILAFDDINEDKKTDLMLCRVVDGKHIMMLYSGADGSFIQGKPLGGTLTDMVSLRDDANMDDIDDVILGMSEEPYKDLSACGRVFLWSGKNLNEIHDWRAPKIQNKMRFGYELASIEDRDKDCVRDVLIGDQMAQGVGEVVGNVYMMGSESGEQIDFLHLTQDQQPSTSYWWGAKMSSSFTDLNLDGTEDILVKGMALRDSPLRNKNNVPRLWVFSPPTMGVPIEIYPTDDTVKLLPNVDTVQTLTVKADTSFRYQWYWNGQLIPGATTAQIEPGMGGDYKVVVNMGCGVNATAEKPVLDSRGGPEKEGYLGRAVEYDKELIVRHPQVEVRIWDDKKEDGDYISIRYNDEWVIKEHLLTWNQKVLRLDLVEGEPNTLSMFALNQGYIPPNTAAISIRDGDELHTFILRSDFQRTGAIRITYKPVD